MLILGAVPIVPGESLARCAYGVEVAQLPSTLITGSFDLAVRCPINRVPTISGLVSRCSPRVQRMELYLCDG